MAHSQPIFQLLAHCQPLFKKKKKKEKKRRRSGSFLFSVSGSSQRSPVYTTSYHLPLVSLLSPSATSVSLYHWPSFSFFKLKLPEFSTLSLKEVVRIYLVYILNIL
jgi:hypothetical protein